MGCTFWLLDIASAGVDDFYVWVAFGVGEVGGQVGGVQEDWFGWILAAAHWDDDVAASSAANVEP